MEKRNVKKIENKIKGGIKKIKSFLSTSLNIWKMFCLFVSHYMKILYNPREELRALHLYMYTLQTCYALLFLHSFNVYINFFIIFLSRQSEKSISFYLLRILPAPLSVFMPGVGLISQGVSEVLVGEEGPGHLVDVVVGADGSEVLDVVPEVRGGVRPVRDSWWFVIRH